MPKVTFIEPGGDKREVETAEGESLMDAAVNNLVKGIDGDCGGMCACATCHVHVPPEWASRLSAVEDEEDAMLGIAEGRDEHSRLGCQVKMTAALDGLVVRIAEHQH
ncbi:MAG: 2Fe-2S iron-sulfur cluster-binding protein [Panacagrimonas sp.]